MDDEPANEKCACSLARIEHAQKSIPPLTCPVAWVGMARQDWLKAVKILTIKPDEALQSLESFIYPIEGLEEQVIKYILKFIIIYLYAIGRGGTDHLPSDHAHSQQPPVSPEMVQSLTLNRDITATSKAAPAPDIVTRCI